MIHRTVRRLDAMQLQRAPSVSHFASAWPSLSGRHKREPFRFEISNLRFHIKTQRVEERQSAEQCVFATLRETPSARLRLRGIGYAYS